jgi:hypothetical protein
MNITRPLLAALSLSLLAGVAPAQSIWKWKDKDGHVQVSDRAPPISVPDKDVLSRPANAGATPAPATSSTNTSAAESVALPASGVDPALEAQRRKSLAEQANAKKAQQSADEAKQAALKADTCRRAKSQLALLESGQRMTRPNENGEREFLDDKSRADELARTRQVMDSSCR